MAKHCRDSDLRWKNNDEFNNYNEMKYNIIAIMINDINY